MGPAPFSLELGMERLGWKRGHPVPLALPQRGEQGGSAGGAGLGGEERGERPRL